MFSRKIDNKVRELIKLLGGDIEDPKCDFANGGGYYQLTPEAVRMFDNAFIEAIKELEPNLFDEYAKKGIPFNILNYYTGRYLDDSNSRLYVPLAIRHTIDEKYRRWGQPYYANNPTRGKDIKLGEI